MHVLCQVVHLVACIAVLRRVWCTRCLVCTIACSCKFGYPFCAGTRQGAVSMPVSRCAVGSADPPASRSCRSLACTAGARSTPNRRHHGGAAGTGALSSTCAVRHFARHSKCSNRKDTCMVLAWRVADAACLRKLWQLFLLAGAGHQHRFRSCSAASSAATLSSCSACHINTS